MGDMGGRAPRVDYQQPTFAPTETFWPGMFFPGGEKTVKSGYKEISPGQYGKIIPGGEGGTVWGVPESEAVTYAPSELATGGMSDILSGKFLPGEDFLTEGPFAPMVSGIKRTMEEALGTQAAELAGRFQMGGMGLSSPQMIKEADIRTKGMGQLGETLSNLAFSLFEPERKRMAGAAMFGTTPRMVSPTIVPGRETTPRGTVIPGEKPAWPAAVSTATSLFGLGK